MAGGAIGVWSILSELPLGVQTLLLNVDILNNQVRHILHIKVGVRRSFIVTMIFLMLSHECLNLISISDGNFIIIWIELEFRIVHQQFNTRLLLIHINLLFLNYLLFGLLVLFWFTRDYLLILQMYGHTSEMNWLLGLVNLVCHLYRLSLSFWLPDLQLLVG